MKITLEDAKSEQIEVIIRGDITDGRIQHIVALLKGGSISSKIILFEEAKEILTDIGDIYYFEVSGRKTMAATAKNKYICKQTLSEISALFRGQGIVQVGKSLLLNIHHVKSLEAEFSGNYVVNLANGHRLIVSRFYMKDFRKAIMEV